ncbi:extracellular solute-binding protein [Kribbella qitaiheensis]|uniref:Extracellular solute-binding protein n=2 Tax=Kribbella qitaiheensis TaxID=1544730 RepID=A0A7G6X8T3_9ACTN|nr:extracellular solute-binding protein [Kribbella qitaiheensis]
MLEHIEGASMVISAPAARLSRRRVLGGAFAIAAGATALAACDSHGSSGSAGVLNVWGGVPEDSGPGDMIAAFEKANPGIKVKYTRYVNDPTGNLKLDTALQGGVPIDVIFNYGPPKVSKRVAAGLLVDLSEKIAAESSFAKFAAGATPRANYVFDGKVYTVPAARSPQLVMANADLLDKAGIEIPADWDVEDYHRIAKQLTVGSVNGSLGSPAIGVPTLGPDANYTKGGQGSNFAAAAWRKQVELGVEMQNDRSAVPHKTVLAQKLQTFAQNAFLGGQFAMLSTQAFLVRYISDTKQYPHSFKVRAYPVPAPVKGKAYWNPGAYGDLMSISAKSSQKDAAWTFLKYWVTNAGAYMIKGGRLPSLPDPAKKADAISQLLGPDMTKLYDVDSFGAVLFDPAIKIPVDTIFTASTEIADLQTKLNDQAYLGSISVDQWVQRMTAQSDAAIRKAS